MSIHLVIEFIHRSHKKEWQMCPATYSRDWFFVGSVSKVIVTAFLICEF